MIKFSGIKRMIATRFPFFSTLSIITKKNLRILTYHGISPLALQKEAFEKQLQFISKNFDTFWVSEIPKLLEKGPGSKPQVVVTFDDGLKNHVVNAMPLLEKYGVKGTFYIPVSLVENQEMLWNHEMRCILMLLGNDDLPEGVGPFSENVTIKSTEVSIYLENLKALDIKDRKMIQDSLKKKRTKEFLPWMLEEFQLMSVEDLMNLSPMIEVGSHTLTHPILTSISDKQLITEIKESRYRLEKLIKKPVLSFCYPNGSYSEKVVKIVEQYYSIAVSTNEGFVSSSNRMTTLNRIPAGKNMEEFLIRLIRPTA
jgi:peptidoglycan/xylan/chitin deacetylase (PgdA/CDA1 family)